MLKVRQTIKKIFESCCAEAPVADEMEAKNLVEAGPFKEAPFSIDAKIKLTGTIVEQSYKDRQTNDPTEARTSTLIIDTKKVSNQINQILLEMVRLSGNVSAESAGQGSWIAVSAGFNNEEFRKRS